MTVAYAIKPAELFLIQRGNTVLKPQFEISQGYSDNITYRENDTQADFLTVASPGLAFQVGSQTYNYIEVSYFFDRLQYWDNDELSGNQHRAGLSARIQKNRLLLEGSDDFRSLSSPIGGDVSVGGIRVDRITWIDNYRLTYDLSDVTAIYLEGFHSLNDYDKDLRLYDSRTLIGTLGFEWKALSRTSFFGEVYYGVTAGDPNSGVTIIGTSIPVAPLPEYPTARFVGAFAGARGEFTERLTGTVKAGYEHRMYSNDRESLGSPVVGASLTERFSEATILTLGYTRTQRESIQFVNSSFVSDTLVLNLQQFLADAGRLRGQANVIYSFSDYDSGSSLGQREDHLISAGLTITYDIKLWWRVFGSYNFEYLDSTQPSIFDYKVNRITLGMQLGY